MLFICVVMQMNMFQAIQFVPSNLLLLVNIGGELSPDLNMV